MTSGVFGFVSEVAGTVASHLPSHLGSVELPTFSGSPEETLQRHVPKKLDMHYITDRVIGMSQPAEAAFPTRFDQGRDAESRQVDHDENDFKPDDGSTAKRPISPEEEARPVSPLPSSEHSQRPLRIPKKDGNSPATLSSFLSRRHPKHFLVVNASDQEADDRTLLLLNRQIIRFCWVSPCIEKSETPTLSQIFDMCYAMHAYLSLDEDNVLLVYCSNGRTRTAIIVACYLKFSGKVKNSLEGFRLFCRRRCPDLDHETISDHIPPSLKVFFRNFDDCVELGSFMNPKPLLLRAIALQGVPVDDKPCIDIWDCQQRHVYSSHPELWLDDDGQSVQRQKISTSQWADEEGFYRVNKILSGDFVVLCRFGGLFADDSDDPSKILFRYANSSGFLSCGPYEFPKGKVDMMRRYDASFDEEDFLLTFMFDSSLDDAAAEEFPELCQPCNESALPRILEGSEAVKRGFQIIGERHAARPSKNDIESLVCKEMAMTSVALQLTNHNVLEAQELLSGKIVDTRIPPDGEEAKSEGSTLENDSSEKNRVRMTGIPELTSEQACANVLGILDGIDVGVGLDWIDRVDGDLEGVWGNRSGNSESRHHDLFTEAPTAQYQPPMMPNRGDIVGAFGDYKVQVHASADHESRWQQSLKLSSRPRMPMNRGQKRQRRDVDDRRSSKRNHLVGGLERVPLWDDDTSSAMELLQTLSHTGVTLQHLLSLKDASQQWNLGHKPSEQPVTKELQQSTTSVPAHTADDERNRDMLNSSKAESQVETTENRAKHDGKRRSLTSKDEKQVEEANDDASQEHLAEKSLKVQEKKDKTKNDEVPLREDPDYVKFFRMLQVGLPIGAVRNALQREGKDPDIMDLDPEKSLKSQLAGRAVEVEDTDPPLQDDPEYSKYFKMMKVGMPKEVAAHAMQRDQKDPAILDLDPEKSLKSQQACGGDENNDQGPPLKDDPEFSKYFKMMKVGMPKEVAAHAMQRDGKDPGVLDLDPEKSLTSQQGGDGDKKEDDGPPLQDDPEYAKYFKMQTMGLPVGACKNALIRDGKDPGIMDLDPNQSLKSQMGNDESEDRGPPLKDDPEFEKYFKMLKMLLPVGAVKQALQRDGKDPSILDLDHNKPLKSQIKNVEADDGPPLKDDPEYAKYFKMLKMGLPKGAVQNAMERDGKSASILDLDQNKSVASQQNSGKRRKLSKKEKKSVRRKKIYWTPIDPVKVRRDSLWSLVQGTIDMAQLKYDTTEFENLFTESSNPADRKKKARSEGGDKSSAKPKKSVQVIDGKRGMNGGIILARLKIEYQELAKMVDNMESKNLDTTQLSALKEFLPTDDERTALEAYLKHGEASDDAMAKTMAALSECEKYMCAMLNVRNAEEKFDCMLFMAQFDSRLAELKAGRDTIKQACDEVRSSERVRKMMAMILTLVNQINTGGSGNMAVGFSLDALLKLNEAKAFDKKTSVLHYLAKLVLQNDKTLLKFYEDIPSVGPAENVILDGLSSDIGNLSEELDKVHQTAMDEASYSEKLSVSFETTGENKVTGKGRTPTEKFTLRAKKEVEEALESIDELKKSYGELLEYFGEDEQLASNDFFGTIRKFIAVFTAASEQVEQAEKKRLKEKLRAAAKVVALSKTTSNSKPKTLLGRPPRSQNVVRPITDSETGNPVPDTEDGISSKKALDVVGKGIAAAAAAASSLRSKDNGYEMEKGTRISNRKLELPMGRAGIAAAAAAAAALRSSEPRGDDLAAAAGGQSPQSTSVADESNSSSLQLPSVALSSGSDRATSLLPLPPSSLARTDSPPPPPPPPTVDDGSDSPRPPPPPPLAIDDGSDSPPPPPPPPQGTSHVDNSNRGDVPPPPPACDGDKAKDLPLSTADRGSFEIRSLPDPNSDEGESSPPPPPPPSGLHNNSETPPPSPPPPVRHEDYSSFLLESKSNVSDSPPPPPPPPAPPPPSAVLDDDNISLPELKHGESEPPAPSPPPSLHPDKNDLYTTPTYENKGSPRQSQPPLPATCSDADISSAAPPFNSNIEERPAGDVALTADTANDAALTQSAVIASCDEPFKSVGRPAVPSSLTDGWLTGKPSNEEMDIVPAASREDETGILSQESLPPPEESPLKTAKDAAVLAAAARRDEAASLAMEALSRSEHKQDRAKDAASLATAARQSEAAALAASAASTRAERITQSAKELAAMATAARMNEAVSLASAALDRSERNDEPSKDAAVVAAMTRKNEAAAAIAAALNLSRQEREASKKKNRTALKPSRQSEAAAAVAAALAASKMGGEETVTESALLKTDESSNVADSVAVDRASVRLRREDADVSGASPLLSSLSPENASSTLDRLLQEKFHQRGDGAPSLRRHADADISGAAPLLSSSSENRRSSIGDALAKSRQSWSDDGTASSNSRFSEVDAARKGAPETMTDDLAELLKARMAIRSAKQTIHKSNESAHPVDRETVPLRPSDVKASSQGTGSRVDANALLWDSDGAAINNDLSAILWDNDEQSSGSESVQAEEKDNVVKQWFRGVMGGSGS